jgi:hypothetical protein
MRRSRSDCQSAASERFGREGGYAGFLHSDRADPTPRRRHRRHSDHRLNANFGRSPTKAEREGLAVTAKRQTPTILVRRRNECERLYDCARSPGPGGRR